jgi:hypothetical protein
MELNKYKYNQDETNAAQAMLYELFTEDDLKKA